MLVALFLLVSPSVAGTKGCTVMRTIIPRPEVAIIMNKQNLTPAGELKLDQSFLPKVVDTVQQKPF